MQQSKLLVETGKPRLPCLLHLSGSEKPLRIEEDVRNIGVPMTVFKPRSRMITVRLSEDEYLAIRRMCALTGARSISDLTRDAMRAMISGAARGGKRIPYLDEVRDQLSRLNTGLDALAKRLESFRTEQKD